MNSHSDSFKPNKTIPVIIVAVLVVGTGFLSYQYFMHWHITQVQTAVKIEQEKQLQQQPQLEQKIDRTQGGMSLQTLPDIDEKRMQEVFGFSPVAADAQGQLEELGCDSLKCRIASFFKYIDKTIDCKASDTGDTVDAQLVFTGMMRDLAEHPPFITAETSDIFSLLHNQAHFFRILNKNRLALVKSLLSLEKDVIEQAMADFYHYYGCEECCDTEVEECIPREALYEYASFFLNTLSGRSYLMRRDNTVRSLARYYSVLIIDMANDRGLNKYGIDLRPHIDLAAEDIQHQNNLLFKDRYFKELDLLSDKYS